MVGLNEGWTVGSSDGCSVGAGVVGHEVGLPGVSEGRAVEGASVGAVVGGAVGVGVVGEAVVGPLVVGDDVGTAVGVEVVGGDVGIGAGTPVGAGEYETWKLAESESAASSQVSVSTYALTSASPGTVCEAAPVFSTVRVASRVPSASAVSAVKNAQRLWSPR